MIPDRFRFLAQVLLCALLWGTAFPLIKIVYQDWSAVTLTLVLFFAGLRFTLAGAGLLVFCTGWHRQLRSAPWRSLAIVTLTQTFLQYVCFYSAMMVSSGTLASS